MDHTVINAMYQHTREPSYNNSSAVRDPCDDGARARSELDRNVLLILEVLTWVEGSFTHAFDEDG